jgi:hypothetical protein
MKASQRSGTHPLAKRLNVCYAVSMTDREGAAMQAEYEASQFTSCPQPLDFPTNPCHTKSMTYNRSQLIDALYREYEFLCHDDFDADVDATPDEYLAMLNTLSDDELLAESSTDEHFTLDEFISTWS